MADAAELTTEELKKLEVADDEEVTPGYTPPAKVDLETLKKLDADDESLQKYKKDLLGTGETLDEGGSNVLVKKLDICFDEKEGKPNISLDLTGDLSKLKSEHVRIKEGVRYKLMISFRVQREIVAGLRFNTATVTKGITVDKSRFMVGSYGPKKEMQSYSTPFDEAPSGMMSRGKYVVKSKFGDDDKNTYLEWQWGLHIVKDW